MSGDDYLWDRSGTADPDVEALERLLAPYAARESVAPRPDAPVAARPPDIARPGAWLQGAWAAAALLALAVGTASIGRWSGAGQSSVEGTWHLSPISGTPRVAARAIDGPRLVGEGTWIDTDAAAAARLDLGDAGRVIIAPGSRVRVDRVTADAQHLHLAHGAIDALIWAPPGQVVIDTPVATAVDLGCAYTLTLGRDGQGTLRVTSGWVGLVDQGVEAFVPAGARVGMYADRGPGIPVLVAADVAFQAAVERFDLGRTADERAGALDVLLRDASPGDALTLWHLMRRVAPEARGRVYDALATRLAPPSGVTRNGVIAGDRAMIDAWWAALGYGDRAWWDLWLRDWRSVR